MGQQWAQHISFVGFADGVVLKSVTEMYQHVRRNDSGWEELPDRNMEWAPTYSRHNGQWSTEWVCLRCNASLDRGHDMFRDVPAPPFAQPTAPAHSRLTSARGVVARSAAAARLRPIASRSSAASCLPLTTHPCQDTVRGSVKAHLPPQPACLPPTIGFLFRFSMQPPVTSVRRSSECGRRLSSGCSGKLRFSACATQAPSHPRPW